MRKKSIYYLLPTFLLAFCLLAFCKTEISAATTLNVNGGSVTGYQYEYGSPDYYNFYLPSAGRVKFTITSYIECYSLAIYDSNGELILEDEDNYWNEDAGMKINHHIYDLTAGTYRLKIVASSYNSNTAYHSGKYQLNSSFTSANETFSEPSNSFAQAKSIGLGATITGQLAENDRLDYYKIYLPQTTRLRVYFTSYLPNFEIYLDDAEGNEVWDPNGWWGNEWNEDAQYKAFTFDSDKYFSPGTYYFKVVPRYYNTGKYRFSVLGRDLTTTVKNGWRTENGYRYYYVNGTKVTGWRTIGGYRYYFSKASNKYGRMLTGWAKIGNYTYYFSKASGKQGRMITGWAKIGSYTYYFSKASNKLGRMLTGWQVIGGHVYYFSKASQKAGRMLTGWQNISGHTYYFSKASEKAGRMLTGWRTISGHTYYFSKAKNTFGRMLRGYQTINGHEYYFNSNGQLVYQLY